MLEGARGRAGLGQVFGVFVAVDGGDDAMMPMMMLADAGDHDDHDDHDVGRDHLMAIVIRMMALMDAGAAEGTQEHAGVPRGAPGCAAIGFHKENM